MIDIVIPIWKPVDWTSFDVVKKIRNIIKYNKVGHAGSLDPFAEGVLMLCTGRMTKTIESFMNKEKVYIASIMLGAETDTLDKTGEIIAKKKVPNFSANQLNKILNKFIGPIKQEPPMYSALKYKGQPLYKLARKGIIVKRAKRLINIYDIQLLDFTEKMIIIEVECGRGTYIRSLAKDISRELGTLGYLQSLKRIRIGDYDRSLCTTINEFPQWLSLKA